jgi:hypothetical protein
MKQINKKNIIILLSLLILLSCNNDKVIIKGEYKYTKEVCEGLYLNKYCVGGGGAHTSEVYDVFLTDSTNFTVYIGQYDSYNHYYYYGCECNGDVILLHNYYTSADGKSYKISKTNYYSLEKLKKINNILDKEVPKIDPFPGPLKKRKHQ